MFGMLSAWVGPAPHHSKLHNLQRLPRILGISNAKTHLVPAGWVAQINPVICSTSHTHLPPPLRLIFSKIRLLRCPGESAADLGLGAAGPEGLERAGGLCPLLLPLQGSCHCWCGQMGDWPCAPTGPPCSLQQPGRGVRGLPDITWNQE